MPGLRQAYNRLMMEMWRTASQAAGTVHILGKMQVRPLTSLITWVYKGYFLSIRRIAVRLAIMFRRSRIAGVFAAFLVVATSMFGAQAADVRIGVPNWTSVEMTAHVIKEVAETRLGLSVELVEADNDTIYTAMGEEGTIDLHPETWLPNHQSYIDRYAGEDGQIILKEGHFNAIQGICVTRDAVTMSDVQTIHDLSDPAKAAAFDHNGDGRGEIWIGAEGWLSTPIEKVRAKTYGYAEHFDLVVMDESDGINALDAAVKAGEPFAFFCYGPHHVFQLYDLAVLEEPAHDPKRWVMITPDQASDWLEQSMIDVAWPPTHVHMAYARSLQDSHPAMVSFLDQMSLNSRQVSGWTYAREVEMADPEPFAKAWVANNADLVDEWLSGAN